MSYWEGDLESLYRRAKSRRLFEEEKEKALRDEREKKAKKLKETRDKEREQWKYTYLRAPISTRFTGNHDVARLFLGEAKSILWTLKNAMKLGGLSQGSDQRAYGDGTVIRVASSHGTDMISIDVSKSDLVPEEKKALSCEIAFVEPKLIHYVHPMRYPHEVKEGEVEGKDYLKLYYTYDVTKCGGCSDVQWEITVPEGCTYSIDDTCWGEIIAEGMDNQGYYIIIKLYTEGMDFNRSGLANMGLRGWIEDSKGDVVCEVTTALVVDCCQKDNLPKPEIYWETWQWVECAGERIFIGGTELCKVPDQIGLSKLLWYAAGEGGRAARFYALPEIGGCPPYKWETTWGTMEPDDPLGRVGIWLPPKDASINCDTNNLISVMARCAGGDYIYSPAACESPNLIPVDIGYTSLIMNCSGSQQLQAKGGQPPYKWDLSGGGTLTPTTDTLYATYVAPDANPGCSLNPTITVTDCCGESADLQLTVNCYNPETVAYSIFTLVGPYGGDCSFSWECGCKCSIDSYHDDYRCDMTLLAANVYGGVDKASSCMVHEGCQPCVWPYPKGVCATGCAKWKPVLWRVLGGICHESCVMHNCGDVLDRRTQAMKDQGCCPINPATGLPF